MPDTQIDHTHNHDHGHLHDHAHQHGSVVAEENHSARAHPEFVVMDIGGGFGGLIVHTDPSLHGEEVHISPAEDDQDRSHKDVLGGWCFLG